MNQLVIKATLLTDTKETTTDTLVDSGATHNLLSNAFALEHGIVGQYTGRSAKQSDGSQLRLYGEKWATLQFVDSNGKKFSRKLPFLLADIATFGIILGYPWLVDLESTVQWKQGT